MWYGGFRPALLATVLSALTADFFLTPPLYTISLDRIDIAKEGVFVAILGIASWLLDRNRRKAEASLRLQHKLLETAAESIFVTDAEHRVQIWNRGAEVLYGWTRAEVLGRRPMDILQTNYPEPMEEVEQKLKSNRHWQGRLRRTCKSGEVVVTQSSWALDEDTGFILQTDLNVTEQDRAAQELERVSHLLSALSRVNQALVHVEEEGKLLQQTMEIIVQEGGYRLAWIAVPEHDAERSVKVATCTGAAEEYLSKIKITWRDEPLGRGPTGLALREGRASVVQDYSSSPECAPWREAAEAHGLRSAVCYPLFEQKQIIAALCVYAGEKNVFADKEVRLFTELAENLSFGITALRVRKRAEEERMRATELEEQLRQSQKIEAVGRLAGGIAHDFNNLLTVIMAQTEFLTLELSGHPLERAESVMKAAKRAAELTGQLLAFSRKQVDQPQIVSINSIVYRAADMARRLVGENIAVRVGLCDDSWPVKIDPSHFEQVVMNLVVNARDAMPHGGELALETMNCNLTSDYIETHPYVPPGRYTMLAISDNGVGMSEEIKSRIFEPYFTTKDPGKGTGLGLAMVYGIVKKANGFVWVYSELGKGTCCKIYLPAVEGVPKDLEPKVAEPKPLATTATATVLLVEDDPRVQDIVREFLTSAGYTVIPATRYEEAFRLALDCRQEIDLLLTDVVLERGTGKQLAESLEAAGCTFKVVYMSGYTPDTVVHHGVLEENTKFLQKPFARATLLAKIQEALSSTT